MQNWIISDEIKMNRFTETDGRDAIARATFVSPIPKQVSLIFYSAVWDPSEKAKASIHKKAIARERGDGYRSNQQAQSS